MPDIRFTNRAHVLTLPPGGVVFSARRYSKHAIGGPLDAEIEASGNELDLLDMLDWLRYGVTILDDNSDAAWWGYIHAVDVATRQGSVGVSLDSMYNSLNVDYTLRPSGASVQTAGRTSGQWLAASYDVYGTKETHLTFSNAEDVAQVQDFELTMLNRHAWPGRVIDLDRVGAGATLHCRGWWYTLDWRYYTNTNVTLVETTAQIAAIETAKGEMLAGSRIVNASGIFANQYREGDTTALAEIVQLLDGGTATNKRLLARVTVDRLLEVYEEPVSTAATNYLAAGGVVLDAWGQQVNNAACPVGFWANYKDVLPAAVNLSYIAPAGPVFIEEAEYSVADGRLMLRSRDTKSPWELFHYES